MGRRDEMSTPPKPTRRNQPRGNLLGQYEVESYSPGAVQLWSPGTENWLANRMRELINLLPEPYKISPVPAIVSPLPPTPKNMKKPSTVPSSCTATSSSLKVVPLPPVANADSSRQLSCVDIAPADMQRTRGSVKISIPLDRLQWYPGKPEVAPVENVEPDIPVIHLPDEESGSARPRTSVKNFKLRHTRRPWKRRYGNMEFHMTKGEAEQLGLR